MNMQPGGDPPTAAGQLWGGRFADQQAPELRRLSRAEPSYFELLPYDAVASVAHANALERAGLLTADEANEIVAALRAIIVDHERGKVRASDDDEDVHGLLERLLVERLGPLGGKLRAGRSRNDQAANDLRLFARDRSEAIGAELVALIAALHEQASRHVDTVAPGFTHLQPGQPVSFGHQLLAHAHALIRDHDRLVDWSKRIDLSPLGAGALAGSAIVHTPEQMATELGYRGVMANSIDAVASRDHVAELMFVLAMTSIDVSRLAEEVTLWVSYQFGWAALSDRYATGSSIMPQKKNPDIAELARGKSGRVLGNLFGLLATMKSLPLAYNRDLFEDKHELFDSVDTMRLVLPAMAGMVATLEFDTDRMAADATARFSLATEVADELARRGVPFNAAHEITGRLVRHCEQRGVELTDLTVGEAAGIDERLTADVLAVLTVDRAIAARHGTGGTAPDRVTEQLAAMATWIESARQAGVHRPQEST